MGQWGHQNWSHLIDLHKSEDQSIIAPKISKSIKYGTKQYTSYKHM